MIHNGYTNDKLVEIIRDEAGLESYMHGLLSYLQGSGIQPMISATMSDNLADLLDAVTYEVESLMKKKKK